MHNAYRHMPHFINLLEQVSDICKYPPEHVEKN